MGAELPRGYGDVTTQVDFLSLELLNWDSEHGNARTLISSDKPKGERAELTRYNAGGQMLTRCRTSRSQVRLG